MRPDVPIRQELNLHDMYTCMRRDRGQQDSWIGLRRVSDVCTCVQATENECEVCRASWAWNDDTAMNWWNWIPREPGISECGRLVVDGWAEYDCSASYRFICEKGILYYHVFILISEIVTSVLRINSFHLTLHVCIRTVQYCAVSF